MKIQVTTGYRCKGLPCIQQEIILLHGTAGRGYYILKSFYYQLLLLKVSMYSRYKGIYID